MTLVIKLVDLELKNKSRLHQVILTHCLYECYHLVKLKCLANSINFVKS